MRFWWTNDTHTYALHLVYILDWYDYTYTPNHVLLLFHHHTKNCPWSTQKTQNNITAEISCKMYRYHRVKYKSVYYVLLQFLNSVVSAACVCVCVSLCFLCVDAIEIGLWRCRTKKKKKEKTPNNVDGRRRDKEAKNYLYYCDHSNCVYTSILQ